MKQRRTFLTFVLVMTMMAACSNPIDETEEVVYNNGFTRTILFEGDISINLKNLSDLPEWLQEDVKRWEKDAFLASYRVFEGKWHGETVYYIENMLSSCIGCQFHHRDGRQFDDNEWKTEDSVISFAAFTNWTCIYSVAPFVKGVTGILHYDSNRSNYVEDDHKRYYIWGYLNTDALQKYDGQFVVLSGFLNGDLTEIIKDGPAGTASYGLNVTYIRVSSQ